MIKAFDLTNQENIVPEELDEILINAGLKSKSEPAPESSEKSVNRAREVFNAKGADLATIAQTVANMMQRGDTDHAKLRASELALKVHGVLQELDIKQIPTINISVTNQFTQENKTLINLVVPNT